MRVGLAAIAAVVLATSAVWAEDWPQWRGPTRDGISREKGLLGQWPVQGPRLLWRVQDVGYGYGSVAVAGGRVFLIGNRGLENEFVAAHDARTGRKLWSTRLGRVGNPNQQPNHPGARSTPTVDGGLLYALGSDGDLVCADTAGGRVVWRKSLRADFGGKPGIWAYSESPLVDGNRLIVTPGGGQAAVVALDKRSGRTLWRCSVPGTAEAGYASAVVMEAGGSRQIVQFLDTGVVGVEAATGRLLWRFDRTVDRQYRVHAATPLASGGLVYTSSAAGGGLARVSRAGTEWTAEPAYLERRAPGGLGGAVLVDGHLYGTSGPSLVCVEQATGRLKWQERSVGEASVVFADGRLYLHGENGQMVLVEASPAGYRERGRFTPPDPPDRGSAKAWNCPAVANGRLYVRDLGVLWVYDIRASAEPAGR